MSRSMKLGFGLIGLGVLGNNYAFAHDLLFRPSGVIWMGAKSWLLVALSLALIGAGCRLCAGVRRAGDGS